MTKALLAGIALLCALCGFLAWEYQSTKGDLEIELARTTALSGALTQAQALRKQEQVIAQRHAAEIRTLKKNKETADAALQKALAENASWAGVVVPGSVSDALRM